MLKSPHITLDELGSGLYQIHLDKKNYRINNVMRILMLRTDFIEFLNTLENTALFEESRKNFKGNIVKLWSIDFQVANKLLNEYLDKIKKSIYFNSLSETNQGHFLFITHEVVLLSYLEGIANTKNQNTVFNGMVFFDNSVNYPNIQQMVFDKKSFWEVFGDAFFKNTEKVRIKYGKHPMDLAFGHNPDETPTKDMNIILTNPKVCQIVFDDTTEKQEIIDYIHKQWGAIESELKASNSEKGKERMTTSANFLRDVSIYNKYIDYKNDGTRNPDAKTWTWLKFKSEFKVDIDTNTIRKIVSLMRSEIKNINTSLKTS